MMLVSSLSVAHAGVWTIDDFLLFDEDNDLLLGGSESNSDHLSRPTFGKSHHDDKISVDGGFQLNNQTYTISNNFYTPFEKQSLNIGEINLFEAKTFAENNLKVQEFLFGIPKVGEAHLAELGVEVWFDYGGEIKDIKVIQQSNIIDEEKLTATHEKTACQLSDVEKNCDRTQVSVKFLEPLKDFVMALKAIDYKNRYQITYLNDGVEILGESLNPPQTALIPSPVKGEGLIEVTQNSKYSPYWTAEDGRQFEKNSFGSFKQINMTFKRGEDHGSPSTRLHSGFGEIVEYEQKRAIKIFDSSEYVSQLPESFSYEFSIGTRIDDKMKEKMLEQEELARKILEKYTSQARF